MAKNKRNSSSFYKSRKVNALFLQCPRSYRSCGSTGYVTRSEHFEPLAIESLQNLTPPLSLHAPLQDRN